MIQTLIRRFVFVSILCFASLSIVAWRASDAVAEDAIEKMLRKGAETINNMTISADDTGVKLERAEAGKRTFTYYYIMSKNLKTDYKPGQFKKISQTFLEKEVCASSIMKRDFFDNGVTVNYVYQDRNRDVIETLTITPKICGY